VSPEGEEVLAGIDLTKKGGEGEGEREREREIEQ